MNVSLLNQIRNAKGFSRSVTYLIIVALAGIVLERTIYYTLLESEMIEKENLVEKINRVAPHKARQLGLAPQTSTNASADTKLSNSIQKVKDTLDVLAYEMKREAGDTAKANQQLEQLTQTLTEYDTVKTQDFERITVHIEKHQLDSTILERHEAMVENYHDNMADLLARLNDIQSSSDTGDRYDAVLEARLVLEGKKLKRAQQPFDPNQLPNQSHQPNPDNKPKLSKDQFASAGLYNQPPTQYAALGDFTYSNLPGATNPAYLSQSDEVVITPAITAKAAELNHDASAIYHWVRNNVVWIPSWGAIQDADVTLGSQRGNAADIATLVIALFRASQIPSRYVHGSIEVPADKFMNWAGGFATADAAARYASSGGIPTDAIVEGGQISKVRIEHIWVEVAADFYPSRAEKNRDADSWVALDASFKQYNHKQGLDVATIANLDGEALATSFLNTGTINETEGWVSGFDPTVLQTAQSNAQTALTDHINTNLPDATVGDVIGGAETIIQTIPGLPSSIPNHIAIKGARYDKLPTQLQPRITFTLGRDTLNQPISPTTLSWAKVNNHKMTLSFKPATQADEDALASLLPEGQITDISQLPTSIPAYLINVIPELKRNGQIIASGQSMSLGQDLNVSFTINHPTQSSKTFTSPIVAGSYVSIATIGGSVSVTKLNDLQTQLTNTKTILESQDPTQIQNLNREHIMGDMFYAGTLGYFAQYTALTHVSGLQQGAHQGLLPSVGTYGYVPKVNYLFGFPNTIEPGGIEMDLDSVSTFTGLDTYDKETLKAFVQQTGTLSSALEHAVPEQMFTSPTNPGEAVSAIKALALANAQGQRTYHITQANQLTALPAINHDASTLNEIQSALAVGKEVITHTDAITLNGWTGAGYIILDPDTGSGAYKISGGSNGSVFDLFDLASYTVSYFAYVLTDMDALIEFADILLEFVQNLPAQIAGVIIDYYQVIANCTGYGLGLGLVITSGMVFSSLAIGYMLAKVISGAALYIASTSAGLGTMYVFEPLVDEACRRYQ